jgi:transglutaminase-like putative cysteine protease
MKTTFKFSLLALFYSFIYSSVYSQDWKKNFADAEAAYTKLSCEINIRLNDGKLSAISSFQEDLQVATENAVNMMSRGHIYHSSFNELKKWEAHTQVSENKKLKVANATTGSSRQDYIFYDDAQATSFDFAGIAVGTTRHIEYELMHNDLHLMTPFYFERYFPVISGELRIVFPSSLKIKYVVKGLSPEKIQFSESQKKDKTTYTFTVSNLAGGQYYPDAPDNSYYATHIVFFIEKIEQSGKWENFLSTPDDLYRYNYNYIKDINKVPGQELQHLTDSLIKGTTSDLEKTKRIYGWVQSNVKYVAFEDGLGGFIPREANLVCNRRFGDCKDMASILTAMLNYAKVPAYFTWIGTRHLPYKYFETPLPIVDNHMICTANINGKFIFLDGTDNGCVFGMPSQAIQGKEALVSISDREYKIIPVEIISKERNQYTDSTLLFFDDEGLKGTIKIYITGYYSSNITSILSYKNNKEREDYFKTRFSRGSNKVLFRNWDIKQSVDKNETWITADIELPDYAKKLSNEWLLNLNLFKLYDHEEIDFPKRKSPIENDFLKSATYTTLVKLPEGFKVSYQPKSQNYKNEVWGFEMQYTSANDHISLTQKFDTNQLMLYPTQFEQWNKVLENLFPHYKQSVIVAKN